MADQPLEDLVARLERERHDADTRYNDALTTLDRAVQPSRAPQARAAAPRPPDTTRVADINRAFNILSGNAPTSSDRSLKGRLRSFIWRIVGPPLEAQKRFNALTVEYINRDIEHRRELTAAVAAITDGVAQELEGLARFESLLVQYLQTITAYVDSKDRIAGGPEMRQRLALTEQRVLALKRDIEAGGTPQQGSAVVVAATSEAPVFSGRVDSVTYVGFEDQFRGAESEIRRRVEDYVPILAGASDVVDVGCGRGELLTALKEQGVPARGVDVNAAMVELCRLRGLNVEAGDALSFLERQADASIGGLVAVQVVEHFEPGYLMRFLEAAHHKMRPGAPLILETINPACWMAFFETYLRDLTHQRALHPDTLRYVVESSGFAAVDVQFRSPVGAGDRLPRVKITGDGAEVLSRNLAQLADAVNAHADKLNARLFSSMDYVVIARR